MRHSATNEVRDAAMKVRRPSAAELQRRIAALEAELAAARERETATAEVLQVINASPESLGPVFDAILEKAHALCGIESGGLVLFDGDRFRLVANHAMPEQHAENLRRPYRATPGSAQDRLLRGERFVHIDDVRASPTSPQNLSSIEAGTRTLLLVPLRKDGALLGFITSVRREVRPFSDREIALLENFAAQAVIAIENARLVTATQEALEQQTATAEVLGVINSSPGDLAPVFEAMLEKAIRLCAATYGHFRTFDGEGFPLAAVSGDAELRALHRQRFGYFRPGPHSPISRLVAGERVVHLGDTAASDAYRDDPDFHSFVVAGCRSMLAVALRKDAALLGYISVYREQVRPFSDGEVALLENFAAQAVIAMENARLITETREALEQQTATAEVLQVINSSPGDLAPVFDAILEKAHRLCDAPCGSLQIFDGERFRAVATRGLAEPFAAMLREGYRPDANQLRQQSLSPDRGVTQFSDFRELQRAAPDDPILAAGVEIAGLRTTLFVPLWKDQVLLGRIVAARQEVRLFTDKQIALLQNFAAQAVIAMENARLLTETREALEQQTATAEVLGVINASPGDLQPVFDAILENAHNLLGIASGSLELYDGESFRSVAEHGLPDDFARQLRAGYPAAQSPATRPLIDGERFNHIGDIREFDFPVFRSAAERGFRTVLFVPLRREETLLGMIACARSEVRPFADKEIALLENFAAQAVIAMENARLITETREALEQQTATAEVLGVINASPGDLAPVFDAMLEKAMTLCDAAFGHLLTYDGRVFLLTAIQGVPEYSDRLRQVGAVEPGRGITLERIIAGDAVVHIPDVCETEAYREGRPSAVNLAEAGCRTLATVALRKEDALLGTLSIYRRDVRPFSDKQIALLQNFAAQAVIAMENARLITETREALEQQTATAEVLGVINSSPGDLAPVFQVILEKAHSLCGVAFGSLTTFDGEWFRGVAAHNYPAEFIDLLRQGFRGADNPVTRPLLDGARYVHLPDLGAIDHPIPQAGAKLGGFRTTLFVPLRREDVLLGMISSGRREVRPFSDKEISLLENFAAQAVIAMENARLITETREALQQQTATAEVLGVINSSPGDLAPVFDAMLEKAMRLCGAAFGELRVYDSEAFRTAAARGVPQPYVEYRAQNPPAHGPGTGPARLLAGASIVHDVDLKQTEAYRSGEPNRRALVDLGGVQTSLQVALSKDDAVLGSINIYRQEVRPFSEKEISLLQNFAAQAVIAMENARLLTETRDALDQQTATAEILQVINSSPGNLEPVFETILEKAHELCGAVQGAMYVVEGDNSRAVAIRGLDAIADALRQGQPVADGVVGGPLLRGERLVHITDLAETGHWARPGGSRTVLGIPLRKGDTLLGFINAARPEVRPFSSKEIGLLESFAAQAVIAMENARLITETREALDQQTATAEVLGVINSSPGDLAPVFDAMVEKAMRLCEAAFGSLLVYDGEYLRVAALRSVPPAMAEFFRQPRKPEPGTAMAQVIEQRRTIRWDDARSQQAYLDRAPLAVAGVELGGVRSVIGVPLIKDNALLGIFHLYRQEVRPFTDKQVALVETFAAQAVIAIENARLITETRVARDDAEGALRELKAAQSSLVQAQKMAALGQLTAGIAHEIKNPLNFVNNFAGLSVELLDELKETAAPAIAALDDDQRADLDETIEMLTGNLDKIAEHGRRADNIVKSMLEHSRGVSGERRKADLNNLVEEALNLAYHGARAQDQNFNITLDRDYQRDLAPIDLAPQEMTRVFLNLFGNGFYAATKRAREYGGGPECRPILSVATRDLGEAVEVTVRDNGTGIPPELREKLFQPFFTTKPTGEGTGLGLSISYDIVTQQHGGTITVDSEPGEFTEFTVRLPRS